MPLGSATNLSRDDASPVVPEAGGPVLIAAAVVCDLDMHMVEQVVGANVAEGCGDGWTAGILYRKWIDFIQFFSN